MAFDLLISPIHNFQSSLRNQYRQQQHRRQQSDDVCELTEDDGKSHLIVADRLKHTQFS